METHDKEYDRNCSDETYHDLDEDPLRLDGHKSQIEEKYRCLE